MFDYLAVGKPIVAASTPAVDEILHDQENALLVDADVPEAWITALTKIMQSSDLSTRLSERARTSAHEYTWSRRGERILTFIQQHYATR